VVEELVPPWDWYDEPLPDNAVFGPRCHLYSRYAFANYRSRRPCGLSVGEATGIWGWTMFELGPDAEVAIGAYCSLVGPVISTNGRIVIGDFALIANEVVLADSPWALPPHGPAQHRRPERSEPIEIHDNVWIGQRAVVLGGAKLREGSVIGARTVVDFEVPPYAVVAGDPARVVGSSRLGGSTAPST